MPVHRRRAAERDVARRPALISRRAEPQGPISINGVQLEIGPCASPFERLDAQVVLDPRLDLAIAEPAAGVVISARQPGALGAALLHGDAGPAPEGSVGHRRAGSFNPTGQAPLQRQPLRRRHAYDERHSINGNSTARPDSDAQAARQGWISPRRRRPHQTSRKPKS